MSASPVKIRRINWMPALITAVCVIDSVMIAYDGSLMGSFNVMPSYTEYFQLNTTTISVNSCSTFLGAFLIAPLSGILIDHSGRKTGLYAACVMNIVGAALAGGAVNIAMFIAGRIVVGFGVGLAQNAAGTYVAETTAPAYRAFALGLYYSCWSVGSLLAAGICYGTSTIDSTLSWRIPSILMAVPPVSCMLILPMLPESPRWLIFKGRKDEAMLVICRINNATLVNAEVHNQYDAITHNMAFEQAAGRTLGLKEAFRTRINRRRLYLALSVSPITMLAGSNIITYYFGDMLLSAGIDNPKTQLQINTILQAWQLVVALLGTSFCERIGRRPLTMGSLGCCTVFFIILAGLSARYGHSTDASGIYGTVACIFLFLGAYSFGLTPLTAVYGPEVLSFNTRATGIALQTMLTKACGVLITMAFPFMMRDIGWKSYIVNASWNVLFLIYIYFQWVETSSKTLEQIDMIFEGEEATSVSVLAEPLLNRHDFNHPRFAHGFGFVNFKIASDEVQ